MLERALTCDSVRNNRQENDKTPLLSLSVHVQLTPLNGEQQRKE